MPDAPQRPCKHPGCGGFVVPGSRWCTGHQRAAAAQETARREQLDAVRGSSHERGYNSRWSTYARGFRARFPISPGYLTRTALWTPTLARQFHTLRFLAAERREFVTLFTPTGAGTAWLELFPIYTFHPSRTPEGSAEVDHIVSVSGPADPLFWEEWNHQALSKRQHSSKTASEDGGFRGRSVPAVARPAPLNSGGLA